MTTVAEWLQSVQLDEYAPLFAQQGITLDILPHLTESDLDRLGLPIGPRRRLALAIQALAAPGAPEPPVHDTRRRTAERRQLTVMFCDLVGSTALAEDLDPEELLALMQAYRAACAAIVERYDGHIAQYLGDGVMVYFGWPHAHEDDAERSVRAALDIVAAVGGLHGARPLHARVGLATGPVVVGDPSQRDAEGPTLAVGETPNLAARLQALAAPDEVVIAPTTRRLVVEAFSLTDLGAHHLKGLAQPVQAWRVDATRRTEGRFTAAHGGMALAPLVGRDEERALLQRRWEQARAGEGQIVLIAGQAGIGKSRLTTELRARIVSPSPSMHFQCSPYHLNSPLHPIIEHLELAAGFARDDGPDERLDKLERYLAGAEDEVHAAAPLFAAMLSLPTTRYPRLDLSPQKQKEKTLEALIAQIGVRARDGALLVVVEDVHWIDPTSQEFLELLVPTVQALPVLLAITYRFEYSPPWSGEANVTSLTLTRLARRQGAALMDSLTGGKSLPPEVRDEIVARTDGVPLFVEELTRSVLESGLLRDDGTRYVLQGALSDLAIPASLRDSLMARLDRLGPVKELAQIGACIGREFSYELLERVAAPEGDSLDASLDRLVDTGLVMRRGTPPDTTFLFKHALVQDAAYDSLLKSRRGELHAKIARVLEAEFADQVATRPEWLAHHQTQAGHLTAAIPLWRDAGALAVGRVALQEAVAHFQQGLRLIDELPPSPERDALELTIREPLNAAWTGLHGWAAPDVGVNAKAVLRLAESQQNAHSLLLAMWWVWTSTITQGRIADSREWVDRLVAAGRATSDLDFRIFGHATAMVQEMLHGDLTSSRAHAEKALALYDPHRAERWIRLTGHDLRTFVEVYTCQLLWVLGYPDHASRLSDESRAHAHADGHAFSLVWALTFSAYVFAYRREPGRLLERVAEADRLAREQGLAFIYEVSVPQAKGVAALLEGDARGAIPLLRDGIASWVDVGGQVRIPLLKAALAEAVALDGDGDAGLDLIDECLEQIARPSWEERLWLPEVLRLKGWMLLRQGRIEEAESELRAAIASAREQCAKSWELRSATTLAGLLARTARREEARDLLAPVLDWFREGYDTRDFLEASALLTELTD